MTKQEQKDPAWEKYKAQNGIVLKEYDTTTYLVWKECQATTYPAWEKFLAKCKEIDEQSIKRLTSKKKISN